MTSRSTGDGITESVYDRSIEERLPSQDRIRELAEYFDRTDTSDPDTWEEATELVVERSELEQLSIRLPREDILELKRRAADAGIGYTTLLRMIVRDHLRRPTPSR